MYYKSIGNRNGRLEGRNEKERKWTGKNENKKGRDWRTGINGLEERSMNEAQEEERWKKEIEIRLEILESLERRDGNERERNKENLKSIRDEGEEKRKKIVIKGVELKNNKEKMEEWMMTKLRMLQKWRKNWKCVLLCARLYAHACVRAFVFACPCVIRL